MTIPRLIEFFSKFSRAPVEVGEIRDHITEWGYCDRITLSPFDQPTAHLRGMMLHYTSIQPYGAELEHRIIRFNQNLSIPWQRLVCTKELMHILDDETLRVSSKLQLDELLRQILNDGSSYASMSKTALYEDAAIYQALAVLCPEDIRSDLFEDYQKDNISLEQVAATFAIPPEYAGTIMGSGWKSFRNLLAKLPER